MLKTKDEKRKIRQKRVRRKVLGSPEKPRLCVFKSLKHIYVQVIDDTEGKTLMAVSTVSADVKGELKSTKNREAAVAVGKAVAEKAKTIGLEKVVFDRNGFLYHGRVKALADAAREAGLKF
jgi:large subunit ribosomal protein L18